MTATLTVTGDGALRSENGQIARIGVVQPDESAALRGEGGSTLRADGATTPVDQPRIVQGATEDIRPEPRQVAAP